MRRRVRFFAGLYAALVVLVCAGYAMIGGHISSSGGLHADDWLTFIPVAGVAIVLLVAMIRIAWQALHDLVAFEVTVDPDARELCCTGVSPLRGIITTVIPFSDVDRIEERQSTYKYVTVVRVSAFGKSGERHVIFGQLNNEAWARSGSMLLPLLRGVGGR